MEVKWIKFKVGSFDGNSFKKIKKAKLRDGTSYRDRLTAIWFELMDLAGKRNLDGMLIDPTELELPFDYEQQFEDIAVMIDREPEEVECAIAWFIKNKMVEVVDNVYRLANWAKYQSINSLEDVREKNRIRNIAYRARKKQKQLEENVTCDITMTSNDDSRIKNKEEDKEKEYRYSSSACAPTREEVKKFFEEEELKINYDSFFNHYSANNWRVGKDPITDWRAIARIWNENFLKAKSNKLDFELEDWQEKSINEIMQKLKNGG